VLPVAISAGTGYDWVRLGLMDLIGARLRAAGLAVVPSDNVVALTGRIVSNDAHSLATELAPSMEAPTSPNPTRDDPVTFRRDA
jgi:hypothetical protein